MNTYIQIYKNKSKYSKLYLALCLGFILFGIVGLLVSFISRQQFIPILHDAAYFSLIFNGSISFWLVADSMKKAKYFVAWNDREISYLLPKAEKPEVIQIENIASVDIHQNEIVLTLANGQTRHFKLSYFYFPERRTIIDFFEEIKNPSRKELRG